MGNVVLEDDDMLEFASADSHRQVIPEEQDRGPSDRDVASKEQERGLSGHDEPSVSGELEQAVFLDAPVVEDPRRVEVEEEGFVVEGVALTSDSSTHTLRAARKSLGISSSGGKQKLYSRFEAHFEERKIALTREAANKAKEVDQRDASSVPLMVPSTPEEVELHELTHVPYARWCSFCIMARGRQGKREVDDSRRKDR